MLIRNIIIAKTELTDGLLIIMSMNSPLSCFDITLTGSMDDFWGGILSCEGQVSTSRGLAGDDYLHSFNLKTKLFIMMVLRTY